VARDSDTHVSDNDTTIGLVFACAGAPMVKAFAI
jgi:hypothetical protein